MPVSVFDLFKIGIGPSSSHTVGPMKAAKRFVDEIQARDTLDAVERIKIELFGSLSATGIGHKTDCATIVGLMGHAPETVDTKLVANCLNTLKQDPRILLAGKKWIAFDIRHDLCMDNHPLDMHPNGMRLSAYHSDGATFTKTYFSIGGGFIKELGEIETDKIQDCTLPFPFQSAEELLRLCKLHQRSISELMLENESIWRSKQDIRHGLSEIWQVMQQVVKNGLSADGVLPGRLNLKRRSPALHKKLTSSEKGNLISESMAAMDWVNLYALATNEENAAGGRIVTAPTNGAAGIIPAVLHYFKYFNRALQNEDFAVDFLLTAGAVGILCKRNASISGAEVGCQGEVGSACAMAAAGLTQILGGTPYQVEHAAEIALEHNLGLTCDPIGGLVQVPCIERNAVAAVKAINAAQMALQGDGQHFVSLDNVIKTMKATGLDMHAKYKETSLGGLAVNVIEC